MIIKNIFYALFIFSLIGLTACEPDIDEKSTLPNAPSEATFDVIDLGDNTYQLVNTTEGGFLFKWDLGNNLSETSEEVTVTYPKAGAYVITLTVFNAGGHAVGSKSIVVANDLVVEVEPCGPGTLAEYLSDCDEKTWRLNPEAGALLVGPPGLTETWWQSGDNEVSERFCAWDDTWTFFEDGTMVYDTKGDIWGEDYLGFDFSCVATADMPEDVAAWGDGEHEYIAIEATQQIQLNGLGAFMGIPKAANGQEVGFPVGSITYDVREKRTNADGKDVLVIEVDYTAGIWQFTFVAE